MFHAVNFINCRVSAVFAYIGADGNVVCKLYHKVSSRVSSLYVVNHQGEQEGAQYSSVRQASIDIYELCYYSINHDPLFSLIQKGKDPG